MDIDLVMMGDKVFANFSRKSGMACFAQLNSNFALVVKKKKKKIAPNFDFGFYSLVKVSLYSLLQL